MTEPAPQKSPHRGSENHPDHVAPAAETRERWRSCLPTWWRILWVLCSHALHSSYSLMDTALQPKACLRAHPRNCLSSLRRVVFCSPGCRSHGPVCSWPGGGRGREGGRGGGVEGRAGEGRGGEGRPHSISVTEGFPLTSWAALGGRSSAVLIVFPPRLTYLVWFPDLFRRLSCNQMSRWGLVGWYSDCGKQIPTQGKVVSVFVIFSFLIAGVIIWCSRSQTRFYSSSSCVRLRLHKADGGRKLSSYLHQPLKLSLSTFPSALCTSVICCEISFSLSSPLMLACGWTQPGRN